MAVMLVDSEDTKHRKERRLRHFRTEVLHIGRWLRRIGRFVAGAHETTGNDLDDRGVVQAYAAGRPR